MALCGELIGNNLNHAFNSIEYPCSLEPGHEGPHYVFEVPRSSRERDAWTIQKRIDEAPEPIPVGSQDAERIERKMAAGEPISHEELERLTTAPPAQTSATPATPAEVIRAGIWIRFDDPTSQKQFDAWAHTAGYFEHTASPPLFLFDKYLPTPSGVASTLLSFFEEHPEAIDHLVTAHIANLISVKDLTETMWSLR